MSRRPPMVRNASDRDQVHRAEKKVRRREQQELEDLRVVMSSREGRRCVRRWLAKHGLYKTCTTASSSMTYALSGRRDAGLAMLDELVELPELYLAMEKEAREDANREDVDNAAQATPAAVIE